MLKTIAKIEKLLDTVSARWITARANTEELEGDVLNVIQSMESSIECDDEFDLEYYKTYLKDCLKESYDRTGNA